MSPYSFSALEIDAIGEIMNISLGTSATAVATMLGKRVDITAPQAKVLSVNQFEIDNLEPAVGVEITYVEGLAGNNVMILKRKDIKYMVETLMGMSIEEEEFQLNELYMSAVSEVMNQMMGASSTVLSEFLGRLVNISPPVAFEIKNIEDFKSKFFSKQEPMVVVQFTLKIEDQLESEFLNVLPIELAKELIATFLPQDMNYNEFSTTEETKPVSNKPVEEIKVVEEVKVVEPKVEAKIEAKAEAPTRTEEYYEAAETQPRMIEIKPVEKHPIHKSRKMENESKENIDLLMGVPLEITVEIGRTKKQVSEILEMAEGSLVVLDKLAGEQVDLYANGRHIAKGDVVVVGDNFGVRVTEIIKSKDKRG